MSSIDILHPHTRTPAQARKSLQGMADKLSERFGMDYEWEGDSLRFSRSGVDGRVDLAPSALRVTAQLGFLLGALKGPIEAEIHKVLAEKFD